MNRLAVVCGICWLALNLLVFAGKGRERMAYDAQIARLETRGQRRAMCWNNGPGMPEQVLDFEGAVDRVRERPTPPHLLLVVTPSTVFPSIARHELFPTPVMQIEGGAREAAASTGADLGIRIGRALPWKIFDPRE